MVDMVFWVVVGMIVGWHVPEPSWAKVVWDKVMGVFHKG